MGDMSPPRTDEEKEGIKQIRRRRRRALVVSFLCLPLFGTVFLVSRSELATFLFALAWILVWVASALAVALSPCPRCKKTFNLRGWYGNPSTRRCLHCGLSIRET